MDERQWRRKYNERIKSPDWWLLRARFIQEWRGRCQRCGYSTRNLQLHHTTYERLGCERDDDLEILCIECHKAADSERAERGRQRAIDAYYDACLDGWASKRYGEDWAECCDYESIQDEYAEWCDRRSNY